MTTRLNDNRPEEEQQRAGIGLWMPSSAEQPTQPVAPTISTTDAQNKPPAPELSTTGAVNAFNVVTERLTVKDIQKATLTLNKYKQGKANLERKIVENEKWYKARHWETMTHDKPRQIKAASGWLFNSIATKHADAMDNFPSANILPREEGDKMEAEKLSSIVPVVLEQNDFEQVYSDVWNYKLMTGTGVYGVYWDKDKLNGLGDIAIVKVDLLNLFWQPGITDIQASRNVFHVELMDDDILNELYPQTVNHVGGKGLQITEYQYDDTVDTTGKSVVVDWYYKKRNSAGKQVLHYCKYVNDVILFATENTPEMQETGLYEHGLYPFVFDVMYNVEGSPAGFGYIDVAKDCQAYIDRMGSAVIENAICGSKPRYFFNSAGAVNGKEFEDLTQTIVHVDGNLGDDSVKPIQHTRLDSVYLNVLTAKIDELKEITGNRDVSNGGTTGGVTSASGIAAMQEAGSRLSRDNSKAAYRAYRRIVLMVIELIRQFYDLPRQFRIIGETGAMRFVEYDNKGLAPQQQEGLFGTDGGLRMPLFDVEVSAQKASPYSKMSQNDLALSFFNAGFFNPELADQALACLDMMDFDRKEFIMQKIEQNGTMLQMIQQLQQQMLMLGAMADRSTGGAGGITQGLMQQFGMAAPGGPTPDGDKPVDAEKNAITGGDNSGESWVTRKARQQAAERTAPV